MIILGDDDEKINPIITLGVRVYPSAQPASHRLWWGKAWRHRGGQVAFNWIVVMVVFNGMMMVEGVQWDDGGVQLDCGGGGVQWEDGGGQWDNDGLQLDDAGVQLDHGGGD